ncbi:hypothetical protein Airi01_088590 [Actinoallomurus iriomotensis]|uniref:Uncharacterized protein n=1 Tax=Actinoallomurus iriomotensis TaxID=478107 RepID=A0A9W6RUW5_9ACTN|nr:hypothetical protein Airi01_088590 [Actinoallomurus iriomotensis]
MPEAGLLRPPTDVEEVKGPIPLEKGRTAGTRMHPRDPGPPLARMPREEARTRTPGASLIFTPETHGSSPVSHRPYAGTTGRIDAVLRRRPY